MVALVIYELQFSLLLVLGCWKPSDANLSSRSPNIRHQCAKRAWMCETAHLWMS